MGNLIDDWTVSGIPFKRRCLYTYMRFNYLKEYALFIIGIKNKTNPNLVPHFVKRSTIRKYAKKYTTSTLIETGTYTGDMIASMLREFQTIYSIELFRPLYEKACLRFAGQRNIHLHFGDSSVELKKILKKIEKPAFFWLDAHYSGDGTAKGQMDTPILKELSCIFGHKVVNHVILIDDATEFTGKNGYPTIDTLEKFVLERNPRYQISVIDNIIRLLPDTFNP